MKKRILETLGLMLVGDGILSALEPQRHCLLWEVGPKPCREMVDTFVKHTGFTRAAGLLEALLGVWLASRQKPGVREVFRSLSR